MFSNLKKDFEDVKSTVEETVGHALESASEAADEAIESATEQVEAIKKEVEEAVEEVKKDVEETVEEVKEAAPVRAAIGLPPKTDRYGQIDALRGSSIF